MAHQLGLVVDRPHRHKPLARTTHRLVDRRRVNLVAFVAAHVGLYMCGRQQPNLMPEFDQRPSPMMRRRTRLHRHHATRQRGEERDQLATRELARHHDLALRVDRVNLKHSLREIETNPRDSREIPDRLAHGRLPFRWIHDNDHHLGTLMPFGAPSTSSFADDASVDSVLEPLADAIPLSTWIIDHTTTAPTPTTERIARWAKRGKVFLHAPVFMSPVNTREGTGIMLVSGDETQIAAVMPELETMTGKVINLGPKPGVAASFKLFGNMTMIGMMGVVADVVRLADADGVAPADAVALFKQFNLGELLASRAAKVASGPYDPPSFTVGMARKDVRLMIDEAKRHDVDLEVMPSVAKLYDAAIARGGGGRDHTAAFRYPAEG